MAQITLNLLGAFEAQCDGLPLAGFESDKVRALLAYLAHEYDRPHRRDSLAGLFWPESDQRRARQSLSQALYNLRKVLGQHASLLEITPQEVSLRLNTLARVDVQEFHLTIQACQAHQHDQIEFCDACLESLEKTAGLYRGELLAGLYLDECEAFEQWLGNLRSHYHMQMVQVWEWLATGSELRRTDEAGIEACQNLLRLDPLNESAVCRLMRLLERSAKRSEALRAYSEFSHLISQELGIQPEAETTRLYESLRDAEARPAPPINLPAPLDILVGREHELNRLYMRLVDPQHRLITLLGPGGVGKTRLALQAARNMQTAFPDGIFLIEISGLSGPEALLPAIARATNYFPEQARGMSMMDTSNKQEFAGQFFRFLQNKEILLVLDSFETLLTAAPALANLLAHAPQMHALVTSRARLNLTDEYVIPLEGLSLQADGAHSPAVRLFEHAASKTVPGYLVDEPALPAVSRICQAVEGMPLGILLAASWVSLLEPQVIERQIHADLDFLSDGWHDLPEHQRSLRATYEYSWSFLNPLQRQALSRLAVFRQSFSAHNAQQICQVSLAMLKSLHAQSLLQVRADGRYRLHDLLHTFCREKLDQDAADKHAVHERFSQFYLEALHAWGETMKTDRLESAVAEMDLEIENARQAWDWALGQCNWVGLEKGLYGLTRYYSIRLRWSESTHVFQEVCTVIEQEGKNRENFRLWFEVRRRLILDDENFDLETAFSELENLAHELELPAWAGLDLLRERAAINYAIGSLLCQADEVKPVPYLTKSLELFRQSGSSYDLAQAMHTQGIFLTWFGSQEEAIKVFEEGLDLCGSQCDPFLIDSYLHRLALTCLVCGDIERGKQLIARNRELASHYPILTSYHSDFNLGTQLMWAGEYKTAWEIYREWLDYQNRHKIFPGLNYIIYIFLENLQGHYEDAQMHLSSFIHPDKPHHKYWLANQAMQHWLRQEYPEMLSHARLGYTLNQEHPERSVQGMLVAQIAYASYRLEGEQSAQVYLLEGLKLVRDADNMIACNFVMSALALLLAEIGCPEAALAVWAAIAEHPTMMNSIFHADVFGRPLAELTANLPDDARQAAQAVGRSRSPKTIAGAAAACLEQEADLLGGLRRFGVEFGA